MTLLEAMETLRHNDRARVRRSSWGDGRFLLVSHRSSTFASGSVIERHPDGWTTPDGHVESPRRWQPLWLDLVATDWEVEGEKE